MRPPQPFTFTYDATRIDAGRDALARLESSLDELGAERALLVCGRSVGANTAVVGPIRAALGERLVGIFDQTTPEKRLATVLDGRERVRALDADLVVGVGGGSSLNVARAICSIAPLAADRATIRAQTAREGALPELGESSPPLPNVAIPTTMPGADLAAGGSVVVHDPPGATVAPGLDRVEANITDDRLLAAVHVYDPALFATTPPAVLARSAMNGFNKGLETIYSRTATPVARAHSVAGLQHYRAGLPTLRGAPPEAPAYDHAAIATMLVQYGRQTNVIHTFGNGLSVHADVQQGIVHAIVTPAVLAYVFDHVDARRRQIADALDIDTRGADDAAVASAIVETVTELRDGLGLPARLRSIDGLERDRLDAIAVAIEANYKHARNPPGLEPTVAELRTILERVW